MFLKSSVLTIEQVYGGRCRLVLPWYQRAYAWGEQHVGRLVFDLIEAMGGPRKRYSLGHMSLAREDGANEASLVDGHQRSISVTMLLALLRDTIKDQLLSDRIHRLIEGDDGAYRLLPQPAVADFFADHVQRRGATTIDPAGDIVDLSPSDTNMIRNRDHLRGLLKKQAPSQAKLAALAIFLMEKCLVVVDEVEDEQEARDLLSLVEDRGLSPHSSEIAKVTIVSAMPPEEREVGGRLLEQAQSMLSADDFGDLLDHIRLIKNRKRSSKAADGELKRLFKINKTGLPFLTDEVVPRAQVLARIIQKSIGEGDQKDRIARALNTLAWIDHRLWVPAALHWIQTNGEGHSETALFFERLERLTYILKIASTDPTEQEYRYIEVLAAIDTGQPVDKQAPLRIEPELLAEALENLRSRTFYSKRCSALVLRRISININPERDPGPVDGKKVTVEHILPRKPSPGQKWFKDFANEQEVVDFCNRIGNLAFLSRPDNNRAANLDYVVKRLLLAQSGTTFVLSADAQTAEFWTRETIEKRSERLIAILLEPWQLVG